MVSKKRVVHYSPSAAHIGFLAKKQKVQERRNERYINALINDPAEVAAHEPEVEVENDPEYVVREVVVGPPPPPPLGALPRWIDLHPRPVLNPPVARPPARGRRAGRIVRARAAAQAQAMAQGAAAGGNPINPPSAILSGVPHLEREHSRISNAVVNGEKTHNEHEVAAQYRRITTLRFLQTMLDSSVEGSTIVLFDCFGSKRTFYLLLELLRSSTLSITISYRLLYQYNVAKDAGRYDKFDPSSPLVDTKYLNYQYVGNSFVRMERPYEIPPCTKLHCYDPIFDPRVGFTKAVYLYNDIYDVNYTHRVENGLIVPSVGPISSNYLMEMTFSRVTPVVEVYWLGRLFKSDACYLCNESFGQVLKDRVFFYPAYKDDQVSYEHLLQEIDWCHKIVKGEVDMVIFTNYSREAYKVSPSDFVVEFEDLPDLKSLIRKTLTQPGINMTYNTACAIRGTVVKSWFLGHEAAPMKNSKHSDYYLQSILEVVFLELSNSVNDLLQENVILKSDPRSFADKNIASHLRSPLMPILKFIREHVSAFEGVLVGGTALVTASALLGTKVIHFGGSLLGSLLTLFNPIVGACFSVLVDPLLEEAIKHQLGPIGYIIHSVLEIVVGAITNPASIPLRLALSLSLSWFDHLTNINPNVRMVFKPLQVLIHALANICGLLPFGFIPCIFIVVFVLSFCTAAHFDYINVSLLASRVIFAIKSCLEYLQDPSVNPILLTVLTPLTMLLNVFLNGTQCLAVVNIIKTPKVVPDPSLLGDKTHPLYDRHKDPLHLAKHATEYQIGYMKENDIQVIEKLQQEAFQYYRVAKTDIDNWFDMPLKQHGYLLYSSWIRFGEMYSDPLYLGLMTIFRVLAPTPLNIMYATKQKVDGNALADFRNTVKDFKYLLPECNDFVLPLDMTLQDLLDYFKSKFTAQKFGLYKEAFEGLELTQPVHTYLEKSLAPSDDHSTEVIPKTDEVLAKGFRHYNYVPGEDVDYCARAIANVKKAGVVGMTWLTENAKHFLLHRQLNGEYINTTFNNIKYIFILGCGVPHKDLATFLNSMTLTPGQTTLVAVASGDDITMFQFDGKVLVAAMSLDLTKYDTAQDIHIITAECEFFSTIMPFCSSYIELIFNEYFRSKKKIVVRSLSEVLTINIDRVLRLSGHADTSFGNTLVNLALTYYIFCRSFSLNDAYDVAMNMKDVGFKYTGARPNDLLQTQTFLRSVFVKDQFDNIRLVPSLGVLIKPLLRIKNMDAWHDGGSPSVSDMELVIRKYYKAYFTAFKNVVTNPVFRELSEIWETDPIEISEDMVAMIRSMFEYTIIGWEMDVFTYDFGHMLTRYTNVDEASLRLFMLRLFSPISTFGGMLDEEDNLFLLDIMVSDYGVELLY